MMSKKKIVIFDLDGTIANIDKRRSLAKSWVNNKIDWDIFLDPNIIKDFDVPNMPVVRIADMFAKQDYTIYIMSGRSDATFQTTVDWLSDYGVPYDVLIMRPKKYLYIKDSVLKQKWLDDLGIKDDVFAVFDDRNQVVDMWRKNGLTCFQVADGDF